MKTTVAWILLLWMSLVLEHARPDRLPSGSLVIPCAVACLFWVRAAVGPLLAGSALIVQWLLHPTIAPVDTIAVMVPAAYLMTRKPGRKGTWSPGAPRRSAQAWWLAPLLVTLLGICVHTTFHSSPQLAATVSELTPRLLIALPCTLAASLMSRTADELGLRRPNTLTP